MRSIAVQSAETTPYWPSALFAMYREFGLKNLQLIADKIHLIRLSPRGGVGADWGTEAFQINFA